MKQPQKFLFIAFLVITLPLSGCYSVESLQSRVPQEEGLIISPADGKIIRIIDDIGQGDVPVIRDGGKVAILKELRGVIREDSSLIVIRMNPMNKHVMLSPIDGEVMLTQYVPGHFHNVFRSGGYIENERNTSVINGDMRVAVIQIAGKAFRRIRCNVSKGEDIERGDKLGSITFGSAVALVVPNRCLLRVKVGDRVKVGESIVGTYTE